MKQVYRLAYIWFEKWLSEYGIRNDKSISDTFWLDMADDSLIIPNDLSGNDRKLYIDLICANMSYIQQRFKEEFNREIK